MKPNCNIVSKDTVIVHSKSVTSADNGKSAFWFGTARVAAGEVEPSELSSDSAFMHIGAPVPAHCFLDGKSQKRIECEGDFDIVPAGLTGRWQKERPAEVFHISWNADFVAQLQGDRKSNVNLLPGLQLRDPHLANIASALLSEHLNPSSIGKIYVESLMAAFVSRLAWLQSMKPAEIESSGTGLSFSQQKRINAYIQDNIDGNLSLRALADICGYGLSRFKVLFKASFGYNPHQYVLNQRIAYAHSLIAKNQLPLNQIALEAGFASQSHMTAAFKRAHGVSPSQFKKTVKD